MHGRLFAHNGVVQGAKAMRERALALAADTGTELPIRGGTDSEIVFALITAEIARLGDVERGLIAALRWIGANVPVYSANLILATEHDLWALRYPETNELFVLQRPRGGHGSSTSLNVETDSLHATSTDLARRASVVIASEPMDDDPLWRPLDPGELFHIGPELGCSSTTPLEEPAQQLRLEDLGLSAAASQAHAAQTRAQRERAALESAGL